MEQKESGVPDYRYNTGDDYESEQRPRFLKPGEYIPDDDIEDYDDGDELPDEFFMPQEPSFDTVIDCTKQILGNEYMLYIGCILMYALIQRFIASQRKLPSWFSMLSSIGGGLCLARLFFKPKTFLFLLTCIGGFQIIIQITKNLKLSLLSVKKISVAYAVLFITISQLILLPAEEWMSLRGSLMILLMKVLSYVFDGHSLHRPNPTIDLLAYALDGTTLVFGPWIPFTTFLQLNSAIIEKKISFKNVYRSLKSALSAAYFLVYADCFLSWLIPLTYEYPIYDLIVEKYLAAVSFRCSQYFVCFVGQTALLVLAMDSVEPNFYTVDPWVIELPRSLVDVVTNWNRPMHQWFKLYVFQETSAKHSFNNNNKALAILATYVASSLLHGYSFIISTVLLSLGFYTFVEQVLREKLSAAMSACVRSRKCQSESCSHSRKARHPLTMSVNFLFFMIATGHLMYLGMPFDGSESQFQGYSMTHVLESWASLHYFSPLLALVMFACAKVFW